VGKGYFQIILNVLYIKGNLYFFLLLLLLLLLFKKNILNFSLANFADLPTARAEYSQKRFPLLFAVRKSGYTAWVRITGDL